MDRTVYYSVGPTLQMGAFYPSLKKWYLPQEVASESRWQWEYTNYARSYYLRYIEPEQEGDHFYDLYGRFLTHGWLIYDWRQVQPSSSQGTGIFKSKGRYDGWFNNLLMSSDTKGQHHFSVTIGDEIWTTLTPMTFRKTAFNGVQFDYLADHLATTILISRTNVPVVVSDVSPIFVDNFTNLLGLRAVWNIQDFVKVGGTFVNAHNGRASADRFRGSPFKGNLTTGQLGDRINRIILRISDDSPEEGEGGPTLFAQDIEITTRLGDRDTVLVGSRIGFRPKIEGGATRNGFLVAEGSGEGGQILLEYVFSAENPDVADLETVIPEADLVNNISKVRFRLLLSNDYRVEVTSDRQTDNKHPGEQPQFRTMTRAAGNVKDNSNQEWVIFDYGLPTATQVFGFTFESDDLAGFRAYGEVNINHQFRQYPNLKQKTHSSSSGIVGDRAAAGWMLNISRDFYPFYLFGEAFGMDAEYNTSLLIVDGSGRVNYADTEEARSQHLYDFVDDNDDNDRKNDQRRLFDDGRIPEERITSRTAEGFKDEAVFPGLDENNDFIPDFNQNSTPVRPNFLPDYEEPFLRYQVDRPEFLFGIDMNNNGWGDRFENDDEPDYPYGRDRRGYNLYSGIWITPRAKISAGQERVRKLSTGGRQLTTYGLFAYRRSYPGLGEVACYNMLRLVEDNIADDLVQWVQRRPKLGRVPKLTGSMESIRDPLAMQNTLVNEVWLDFKRAVNTGLTTESKVVFAWVMQRGGDARDRNHHPIGEHTWRLGIIDRFDYLYRVGSLSLQPRCKLEFFMDDTPYNIERLLGDQTAERSDLSAIPSLLLKFPLMKRTAVEAGLEYLIFRDFVQEEVAVQKDPAGLNRGDPTGDYSETSIALQLSNTSHYLGYNLVAQIGIRVDREKIELFQKKDRTELTGLSFITVYAGIQ